MNEKLRHALNEGENIGQQYTLLVPHTIPRSMVGMRLGWRTGTSIDFQDYREYQPGDDIRFVDWNVYARSDRLTVKLYMEEVTPHLDVLIDGSRSMNLGNTTKAAATLKLAAILAVAAENAYCSHAVWISDNGFRKVINDFLLPTAWDGFEFNSPHSIDDALEVMPPTLRPLSIRVLISDLLWPATPIHTVQRLQSGGAALFILQLLARNDIDPPIYGSVRLVDSETDEIADLLVDETTIKQYRRNLTQWQQSWAEACRQYGAQLTTLVAEELESSIVNLQKIQLVIPV